MKKLELLSPAKNLEVALAAIQNGADAVYIGGPAFGARKAVGNSIEDITRLVSIAHRFYCRVFVTMNTILYDEELLEAEKLIKILYRIGVDAIIVQDPGILKLDIPPIALHASTQMHNYELERIKFLDKLGFQRIVLARELSLEEIKKIRQEVRAELEYFVHGALCVSLSGQCYMSHYLLGRSANRGECAQACRMKWNVEDASGKLLLKEKHVLSLKDLNLSDRLVELAEVGIDSFKIEGRLKDTPYVANVTNYYSSLLNKIVERKEGYTRVGSGRVSANFEADPERSFNRGYSEYFYTGRQTGLVNMDTPKSMGKKVAEVRCARGNRLQVNAFEELHNADGVCYLENGELRGIKINTVEGEWLNCNEKVNVSPGTQLYRNYDHQFVARLEKGSAVRKIGVRINVYTEDRKLILSATDEDQVCVTLISKERFDEARQLQQIERTCQQLKKCGDTDFRCDTVEYHGKEVLFVPSAVLNAYRRQLLENMQEKREELREKWVQEPLDGKLIYTGISDWRLNVVNKLSLEFYREHGIEIPEKGFELRKDYRGKEVMTTRYCLLFELGLCRKTDRGKEIKFPLYLSNNLGRFQLEFDCQSCVMKVIALK